MTHADYLTMMIALYAAVAVLGAAVAAYALLAWRRQRSAAMLTLATGLILLSIGPTVVWVGVYAIADNLYDASAGCAGFLAAGFALLLVSVRVRSA